MIMNLDKFIRDGEREFDSVNQFFKKLDEEGKEVLKRNNEVLDRRSL